MTGTPALMAVTKNPAQVVCGSLVEGENPASNRGKSKVFSSYRILDITVQEAYGNLQF